MPSPLLCLASRGGGEGRILWVCIRPRYVVRSGRRFRCREHYFVNAARASAWGGLVADQPERAPVVP